MESINAFMSRDHDRLDAIFRKFQKETDETQARELFDRFEKGLRLHIEWEEKLLFPPFEEKTGMRDAGPTAVMRMEHEHIQQLLEIIRSRIGSPDVREPSKNLTEILGAHNHKEENILYPWIDRSLQEKEREALLARIKETAQEA